MNKQVKDKEKEEKRLIWADFILCQAGISLNRIPSRVGLFLCPGRPIAPAPGWGRLPPPGWAEVRLTRLGRNPVTRLGLFQ